MTGTTVPAPSRLEYLWSIQLAEWRRGLASFLCELRRHPLALLAGLVLVAYLAAAALAPALAPHSPFRGSLRDRFAPPAWSARGSLEHVLGTDDQGRDILSRVIFGTRVSLRVGFLAVAISAGIGLLLGAPAGYFRGRFDALVSRAADLLMAFPFLIFAIGVMAFLGPGFTNLILALTFKGWVEFFRLVRGEVMAERTKDYVEAARVAGRSRAAVIGAEILPNIAHSVLVLATLRMGDFIIMEASLSFLGLGIQPPTPAWGSMVAVGREYLLTAWWVSTFPGLAILFLVLAMNVFGEGLRDILDPRLKERR